MPFSWSRSGNTNCMSGGHGDSSPAIDALRTSSMTLIYILLSPDRTLRNEPWPQLHVNYAETVLPMRDGLPKLRDFPAEMGGSGEIIAE